MAGFRVDMSPLERGSARIGQGLVSVGRAIGDSMQRSRQEDSQQEAEALMNQALGGDPEAFQQLMVKSPPAARMVAEHLTQQQATQQGEQDRLTGQIAQDTAGFVEQMHLAPPDQQEAMFNSAVDDPRYDIDEEDRAHFMDVNARMALVSEIKGLDYAKNFFGGGGKVKVSAETETFNDLIKDFTPEQKKTAKLVKAGLKGRAISNAELSAIESGDIKNYSQYKIEQKQAEKFAELTGSSRSKAIDKGFESIVKIDAGMKNIDRAIAAVQGGAGVGAVEKLWPSIKASSVELDNIRGQMALDVVGATTFGALSKGELDLAKDIALPTGLDSDELIVYLQDKKAAQEKLKAYYNEQIQFLDQGGTVAGFLRSKEGQAGQAGAAGSDELSDEDLVNKYGG